jgi:hypothetical protein
MFHACTNSVPVGARVRGCPSSLSHPVCALRVQIKA